MLAWLTEHHPDASGYWPAQAVASSVLTGGGPGSGTIDSVTAMTTCPLFDYVSWDEKVAESAGATPEQLPRIVSGSTPAGRCGDDLGAALSGAVVGGGTIDAFAEQLVAGADHDGDVLVILGATLIIWACVPNWYEAPGLWTIPHTAPGKVLIGGPSNAGGLLRDWASRSLAAPTDPDRAVTAGLDPDGVPVLLPYLRGERTPLHDPTRRGSFHGLSLAHGPDALWRSVYEATGHSIRHHLELANLLGPGAGSDTEAGTAARRIVATGGGTPRPGLGPGDRGCHGPAGRLRRGARGRRVGRGLPRPRRRRSGARCLRCRTLGVDRSTGRAGPGVARGGPVQVRRVRGRDGRALRGGAVTSDSPTPVRPCTFE